MEVLAVVSPSEHAVLIFLVQLALILTVARLLGTLMSKFGQPAVVGELIAGVILGPSVLGAAAPDVFEWIFPSDDPVAGGMLFAVAWIGLLFLLAATGFETDLGLLRRLGRPAATVTAGSLIVPLLIGVGIGLVAPTALQGDAATTAAFAGFFAVALSISSLPVVARVLGELGMIRRNVGQMILSVAMANDVIGWILLGLVAGLADAGTVQVAKLGQTVAAVAIFLLLAMTIGSIGVDRLFRRVADTSASVTTPAVVMVVLVLGMGAITQALHVEAVLGAFVAGVLIARSRWRDERAIHLIESTGNGIFAPVFFATAGLRIDLEVFLDPTVAVWSVIVIVAASISKFLGAWAGARAGRLPPREGLALGVGLNARGALEIVIGSVGLSIGVLNEASYGVIVVMAIVTSVMTPPLLRLVLRDWEGTPEEQERLAQEKAARTRVLIGERSPIVSTDDDPSSIVAAQVAGLAWPAETPVTVAAPVSVPDRTRQAVENVLLGRPVRDVDVGDLDDLVEEVRRGHGAVVVGLPAPADGVVIPEGVEELLATVRVPVVLVRGEQITGRDLPMAFGRALIPVSGTVSSKGAQELGAALSGSLGTELVFASIEDSPTLPVMAGRAGDDEMMGRSDPLLTAASEMARSTGVDRIRTLAQSADNAAVRILQVALEEEADVILLGSTRRVTDEGEVQLGAVASYVLETSPTTVIVVAMPAGWAGWH